MESLTLVPEPVARRALRGRAILFTLLRPGFPALGIGKLRVLRVREEADGVELIAGYDRYERLDRRP